MRSSEETASDVSHHQRSASFFGWLFSQKHFHVKLLSGTAAGVIAIIFFAAFLFITTYRSYHQETLRAHTVDVMRMSSVVLNDIAVLETAHRSFILTGKPSYLESFEEQRNAIKPRLDQLTDLIVDSPAQRKRILKVQDVVQRWTNTYAVPAITAKQQKTDGTSTPAVGSAILDEARDLIQAMQNEEQILLNERIRDQEWAAQSTQILDVLPKLERSVVEMEREKQGYLLTGDVNFADSFKRAANAFFSFHGYLSVLVAANDGQANGLRDIRTSLENWMNTAANPEMDARRAGRDFAAIANTDGGEVGMRGVREKISNFAKTELDTYQVRAAAASRQRIVKISALGTLCLFAIILLIASNSYSCVLVRRQLSKLDGVETRIKSIIDNILDGMITVDEKGVICSMNPAAEKMFGCVNNEMVGHNFIKLVPKTFSSEVDVDPKPCAWHDLAKRTGGTTLALGRTRRHATFPVEISLSEMIVDGKLLYVGMIRNVTERKHFEQEIAAEKESLAVTLRSIEDGVITTDVQGKIIMINNAGETMTGWSAKDAIGQPVKAVFSTVVDLSAQARATQRSGYRNEAQSILLTTPENATLKSRDGTERVIEQVASPIRDNKNEVAGVVLVFRDITERQRMEAERRKADAIEQLGLVAGGIAHDFNNLLTAIIGNISLASLVLPPESEMTTRLNDAKNASMRARDLAQQLLTFARGGAPIKQTASISKLVQDTVSFSLRGAQSRSQFNFGDNLWPAEIDSGQISQVISNLVVNADQAMPNGGTLRVTCENFDYDPSTCAIVPDLMPGDYIRISIRDEGVGIPEDYLKRIFDPYFTTKAKGNGLGLATTYSIMKNHNGLITVDSQVHFGSTFTLYLPALRDQAIEVEQAPPSTITPVIEGSGRVLIVDDEETIRDLVDFTLSHIGYTVVGAETALDGVNLYREKLEAGERFDCVILDLTLPGGMGGKEALKRLIEIDPTVTAVVSSGYAMDDTMSRFQDYGFRGVIAKPYEAAELGRVIHEVIESNRVQLVEEYEGGRLATRVA